MERRISLGLPSARLHGSCFEPVVSREPASVSVLPRFALLMRAELVAKLRSNVRGRFRLQKRFLA